MKYFFFNKLLTGMSGSPKKMRVELFPEDVSLSLWRRDKHEDMQTYIRDHPNRHDCCGMYPPPPNKKKNNYFPLKTWKKKEGKHFFLLVHLNLRNTLRKYPALEPFYNAFDHRNFPQTYWHGVQEENRADLSYMQFKFRFPTGGGDDHNLPQSVWQASASGNVWCVNYALPRKHVSVPQSRVSQELIYEVKNFPLLQ